MNIRNNSMNQGRFGELPLLLMATGAVLLLLLMALPYVAPIVLGVILSAMMEPIIRFLGKRRRGLHITRTPATLICLVLFLAVLGTALFSSPASSARSSPWPTAFPPYGPTFWPKCGIPSKGYLPAWGCSPTGFGPPLTTSLAN